MLTLSCEFLQLNARYDVSLQSVCSKIIYGTAHHGTALR